MAIRFCKCCGRDDSLSPLWSDADGGQWYRCASCGSDSADRTYAEIAHRYDSEYVGNHHHKGDDPAALEKEIETNVNWFQDHKSSCPDETFLDVGHNEGTSLRVMQAKGWSVHGWDCNPAANQGKHTTIYSHFHAGLFPRQYSAVLSREALEHVPGWRQYLFELSRVVRRDGLVQIQTPRPTRTYHPIPYQWAHLQLLSPVLLRWEVERMGMRVIDSKEWELGQAILCRRIDG